jgi:DNA-directed RNA polymerase subunit RPC12/RpoP
MVILLVIAGCLTVTMVVLLVKRPVSGKVSESTAGMAPFAADGTGAKPSTPAGTDTPVIGEGEEVAAADHPTVLMPAKGKGHHAKGGKDAIIGFLCSKCRAKMKAKPSLAGKMIKCPKCGVTVKIPPPAG